MPIYTSEVKNNIIVHQAGTSSTMGSGFTFTAEDGRNGWKARSNNGGFVLGNTGTSVPTGTGAYIIQLTTAALKLNSGNEIPGGSVVTVSFWATSPGVNYGSGEGFSASAEETPDGGEGIKLEYHDDTDFGSGTDVIATLFQKSTTNLNDGSFSNLASNGFIQINNAELPEYSGTPPDTNVALYAYRITFTVPSSGAGFYRLRRQGSSSQIDDIFIYDLKVEIDYGDGLLSGTDDVVLHIDSDSSSVNSTSKVIVKAGSGGTEVAEIDESGNLQIDGDLTVAGNDITFGNGATIVNTDASTLTVTEASTVLSGDLTVNGGDITAFKTNGQGNIWLKRQAAELASGNEVGRVMFQATENGSDVASLGAVTMRLTEAFAHGSNHGCAMDFWTTPNAGSSNTKAMSLTGDNNLELGGNRITFGNGEFIHNEINGWISSHPLLIQDGGVTKAILRHSSQTDDDGPELAFQRNNTDGFALGDNMGEIRFRGSNDGSTWRDSVMIIAEASETWDHGASGNWGGQVLVYINDGSNSNNLAQKWHSDHLYICGEHGTNAGKAFLRIGDTTYLGTRVGTNDQATFQHWDVKDTAGSYGLIQGSDGTTYLNAASGKILHLRIANTSKIEIDGSHIKFKEDSVGWSGLHGKLWSDGSMYFHIDENQASAAGDDNFRWYNGSDTLMMQLSENGNLFMHNDIYGNGGMYIRYKFGNWPQIRFDSPTKLRLIMPDATDVDESTQGTANHYSLTLKAYAGGAALCGIRKDNPAVALDVNGSIQYTGSITDVSDSRLKENVEDIEDCLNKISQLEPKTYTMVPDISDDPGMEGNELGFIAQSVQEIFPDIVRVVQENDEETGEEVNYLGVSYIQLIAPLVGAVKELKAQNEQLLARIEALES